MSITQYIRDTKAEMAHVKWPSRKQSILYTAVVVVFSVLFGVFLGLADTLFSRLLGIWIA
jgi:preprotein translocase SecE subunit